MRLRVRNELRRHHVEFVIRELVEVLLLDGGNHHDRGDTTNDDKSCWRTASFYWFQLLRPEPASVSAYRTLGNHGGRNRCPAFPVCHQQAAQKEDRHLFDT